MRRGGLGLVLALITSFPLHTIAADAADEWQEIVTRSQATDAAREGRTSPPPAPAPTARRAPARKPGAYSVTGHAGSTRSEGRSATTPGRGEAGGQDVALNAGAAEMQKSGGARSRAGPGITIISGGNSSDGAPKVGRLPIMR